MNAYVRNFLSQQGRFFGKKYGMPPPDFGVGICVSPPKIYYFEKKNPTEKINPCGFTLSVRISLIFVDVFYLLLILPG